jgi:hypothetical protein
MRQANLGPRTLQVRVGSETLNMDIFPLKPVGRSFKSVMVICMLAFVPLAWYDPLQNVVASGRWFGEFARLALDCLALFAVFGVWVVLVNLWAFLRQPITHLGTSELSWGVPFLRRKRSFADIAAVQIIASHGTKQGFVRPATTDTYQANIVFRVGQPQRLFLFGFKKIDEVRRAAKHIADLLKVQVVDLTKCEEEATSKWQGGHSPAPEEHFRERGPIE